MAEQEEFTVDVVVHQNASGHETIESYKHVGKIDVSDGHLVLYKSGSSLAVAGFTPGEWVKFSRKNQNRGKPAES